MSPPSTKTPPAAEAVAVAAEPALNGFASRTDILGAAGHFAEEEHELEGVGKLLLSEISGAARAEILGQMATAIEGEKLTDPTWTSKYQKTLLRHGIVDPSSPPAARTPLFKEGDLDAVMQLGGGKLGKIIDAIERLSRMGRYQESAEKNSAATQNGASTSA